MTAPIIWIISDGKTGNDVQSKGVASALGLETVVKHVDPKGLQKVFSPWAPLSRRERFGEEGSTFAPPWPRIAISIGRLTTPYLRALKQRAGEKTFTVVLQNPKVPLKTADLFWVPLHDKLRGENVVTTLTAPHGFTEARLNALAAVAPPFAALPRPWTAIMLGGSNGDYLYSPAALARLKASIAALGRLPGSLLITPSRRTEAPVVAAAREAAAPFQHMFWDMQGENPYPSFLAHADRFVVPADSVNMTGEPCATGRPVYVFYPDGGSAKFRRFHEALEKHGATRPLPQSAASLEAWGYAPLRSADAIAAEIRKRAFGSSH